MKKRPTHLSIESANKEKIIVRFHEAAHPEKGALVRAGYYLNKSPAHGVRHRVFEDYAVIYLLEGEGTYEDKNGRRPVSRGDVIFVFPRFKHSYYAKKGSAWSECFFVFKGGIFRQLEKDGLISRKQPVVKIGTSRSALSLFNSFIQDFLNERTIENSVAAARVHLLLAHIVNFGRSPYAENKQLAAFIEQARETLNRNLESDLDLKEVARSFNLSYEIFRKRFRELSGLSPHHYRILQRIDWAKALIIEGNLSVKEISKKLGYSNLHFFHRQFKKITGHTPVSFRRNF